MKANEAHRLKDEEIDIELKRLRRHQFDLRCQAVTEKIEDTSQFGKVRKDIARLMTEKRRRQLDAEKSEASTAGGTA